MTAQDIYQKSALAQYGVELAARAQKVSTPKISTSPSRSGLFT